MIKWIKAKAKAAKKAILLTVAKPFEWLGQMFLKAVETLERIVSTLENAAE